MQRKQLKKLLERRCKNIGKIKIFCFGSSGKATIVERKDGRYIDIEEMAQHVAFNVLDDYSKILNGEKKIDETNIRLSINVLNAVAPLAKYLERLCLRKGLVDADTFAKVGLLPKFLH